MAEDGMTLGSMAMVDPRTAIGVADTVEPRGSDVVLDLGSRIRQYELIRELGRGGMGRVYLARDIKLARRVAIKVLATTSRQATDRFLEEARTTALVNHENIVVIHEVDEHEGSPHMVLEYLEGRTLRELMRGRAFTPARAVELITPVVRAVARAHAAGIVHRDLKPENIIVTVDGAIKVLDFGIAKALVDPHAPQRVIDVEDLVHADGLTDRSVILGTPQYMAPEQFGFGTIDHRSDLWAIGVILFELATGRHPITPFTALNCLASASELDEPLPRVGSLVGDLPERLERVIDRCLAKRKANRYPDAAALLADLEPLLPGKHGRKLREDEGPYPGLTAFQEDDADRFFGRGRDIARVVTRMRDQPLLAIAGPSGIGKSSFVRAGIVPAIKGSGEAWEVYVVRPGRQPLASLAGILAPLTRTSPDGTRDTKVDALKEHETLVDRLAAEPGYLGSLLRERAARKNTKVLLFVDQFEELYTHVADAAERGVFTSCLAGAADDASSPIRIVVSIRSDFLDRVGADRGFIEQLTPGLVFLQPLGRPELREALTRPLAMHDYAFETDELVDRMLDELAATPGALPLLQFAAARLWDARDRRNKLVTSASHDLMGGISGALATHADQVLAALPVASHALVRAVFQRLTTPERTRAIVELDDLRGLATDRDELQRALDQLVAARLLVIQTPTGSASATVEIVHESLLENWPTLRRWLDEDQEDSAFLAQLAISAKQWETKGRAPGLLWRGEAMEEARRWQVRRPRPLPARDQAFLDAVVALARRGKVVRRAIVTATLLVLAAIAAGTSIAYVRVRAAEQLASENATRAERALAARTAEEAARRQAEDDRTAALAALLTEAQLREAAEAGLLTAEQLKAVAEARQRVAERSRARAEAGLATAQQNTAAMKEALRRAEEERRTAELAAQQQAAAVELTREQLLLKNQQLEAALAAAKTLSTRAEAARADAAMVTARLKQALAAEQARTERLVREQKKITTDLK